jgi:hypothetical protein
MQYDVTPEGRRRRLEEINADRPGRSRRSRRAVTEVTEIRPDGTAVRSYSVPAKVETATPTRD